MRKKIVVELTKEDIQHIISEHFKKDGYDVALNCIEFKEAATMGSHFFSGCTITIPIEEA